MDANSLISFLGYAVVAFLVIFIIYCIVDSIKTKKRAKKAATHFFKALNGVLGPPYPTFTLSSADRKFLVDRNYNPEAIYHLVVLIMIHLKAPYSQFNIKVSDGTGKDAAGLYYNAGGLSTIDVLVRPYYTGDQVIAIVCHECMHHFLGVKKIKGKTEGINECLTDFATVYTGFGQLMQTGYTPVHTKVNGIDKEVKVGYITDEDIRIAMKVLKSFQSENTV